MMLIEGGDAGTTRPSPADAGMGTRTAARALIIVATGALTASGATNAVASDQPRELPAECAGEEVWTQGDLAVDEQASTALVEDQGSLVMELRRRSGLTWEKLGELFGVDRRSVHNWASGRPMNAGNRERLGRILAMVRRLPEDSEAVRSWLLSPDANDELPFDLLRDGRYDEVALPPGPPAIPFERPKYTPEALRARAPLPPEVLVGAQQDSVHRDMKGGRPVRSVRVKG